MMEERLAELPKGWAWTTIGKLAEKINPGFPSGKHNRENRGVPHLRPMNISVKGDIDLSNLKYVEEKDYEPLLKGDVLFNNTNSPELLGKTSCIKKDTNWAYSNHMTRIRVNQDYLDSPWIAYGLHRLFLLGFFKMNCVHHVNQASINTSFLTEKVSIPLPPLPEQHRIVAKIEELFTRLDAGVEALKKIKAQLKRYRQAVLKYAFEGKLTQEWREANKGKIEPASVLLGRIGEENKDIQVRRDVPGGVVEYLQVHKLPKDWLIVSVATLLRKGGILDLKDGNHGANHPKVEDFSDDGMPFITASQVENFSIDYDMAPKLKGKPLEKLKVGFAKPNDVILTHKGTVGRVGICKRECILSPQTTYYRVNQNAFDKNFLAYCLASPFFQEQLSNVKSQTTRDFVSISKQYGLFLLLAPRQEQNQVALEIQRHLSFIDELEKVAEQSLKQSDRLRQSILKQAFEGRLVPQDPTDEPAEKLLDRIKEEKAKREGENKREKKHRNKNPKQMELI